MKKNYILMFLAITTLSLTPAIYAQNSHYSTYSNPDSTYSNDDGSDRSRDYSHLDYHYNNLYYGHMTGGYRDSSGAIHFGRSFDNSDNFSSGISSYQGTSTGPGPNGGYPGTPRGTYPTNYVDTSIYPNSYMRSH